MSSEPVELVAGTLVMHHVARGLARDASQETTPALVHAGIALSMGSRLYGTFLDAGLPAPQLRAEVVIGAGPDDPVYQMAADLLRRHLPIVLENNIATAQEVDIDTFERRFQTEVVDQRGIVIQPPTISAWTHTPQRSATT